jgi:hypothetical protein
VDYTMADIQKISLSEIVSSVPDDEIWKSLKFVRYAEAI